MELKKPIELGKAYCFMCATLHDRYRDAHCEVFSLADIRYIPVCCECCEEYLAFQPIIAPMHLKIVMLN